MTINLLPDSKAGRNDRSDRSAAQRRAQDSTPAMSLQLKVLIAAALVGFGILHYIGTTMMQRASGAQPIDAMRLMHNED